MNVAAYQEKKKNKKTGKKKAGEERRQATDFKEAACCPSAVIQGQHDEKMVCVRGVCARCNWDPWEGQQPFRPNPHGVRDRSTTLRRLLIGAVQFCSLYIPYIQQKFCDSLFTKIKVNTCFGDGRKICIDD